MLDLEKLPNLILGLPVTPQTERVSLNESVGRILAQNLVADRDQPAFNKSAVDGWAIRRSDLEMNWIVQGEIAAGFQTEEDLLPGACWRIFTGAPVPPGADMVVMQELVEETTGSKRCLSLQTLAAAGGKETLRNNICQQGEDLRAGDLAIAAGIQIGAAEIAVLASCGKMNPLVFRRPRMALLCTGTELVEPQLDPREGQIRCSNGHQISCQAEKAGATVDYFGIIPDDAAFLEAKIMAMAAAHELVVVTGGASVGDYDFMGRVLANLGATIGMDSLGIQPGKPVLLAQLGSAIILGLSGNPVSAYLQFELVARPLIRRLCGATRIFRQKFKLPLAGSLARRPGNRVLFVPMELTESGAARQKNFNGSAHSAGLVGASLFAILPTNTSGAMEGEFVEVMLLDIE